MTAAAICVRDVFPTAKILGKRKHEFPIQVSISAQVAGREVEIWTGEQQSLFFMYKTQRTTTMEDIRETLSKWQNEYLNE
jgi:hypothetical protein